MSSLNRASVLSRLALPLSNQRSQPDTIATAAIMTLMACQSTCLPLVQIGTRALHRVEYAAVPRLSDYRDHQHGQITKPLRRRLALLLGPAMREPQQGRKLAALPLRKLQRHLLSSWLAIAGAPMPAL